MVASGDSRGFDVVVVGAGHNGLVCAAYLARAGLRTLVLERREEAGGAAALAGTVGRLRRSVIRDLGLESLGLELLRPEVRVFAPQPDGGAVTLWADPARTADELSARSRQDGPAYPGFDRKIGALASFLAHLAVATPPNLSGPSLADAFTGLRLGRALRGFGNPRAIRELARVLPMSVADLVEEELDDDALRAAVASRGVRFTAMGPRSAGTAAVLLMDSAGSGGGAAGESTFVRGGPPALARSLVDAARSFGAEVRCGAEVAAIRTEGGRVGGVALASGQEIDAPVVVSGLDPKRTLLGLVDPVELGPTLVWRAGNIRAPGAVAHVDLELDRLPRFPAARGDDRRLAGRIVLAPGLDHLERAHDAVKYGRMAEEPFLEATIPTLTDPALEPEGRHRMRVLVQGAPYHLRAGTWSGGGESLGDLVLAVLEGYAPGIGSSVTARRVATPADLEREFGLTEGHPLHAEPGLDQFFAWRPLLGHARYRLAVPGLYLCGSGAHPGGGVTGGPGANAAREVLADRRRRKAPGRSRATRPA
ncbi:MAG: NAD(P)/FAD-dependent oxidoreductase [Actinomycetota bacterium]|nr:NAD(P)/FAD-dependent oxidoreductase [Actinomycetota bacterium]